MIYNLVGIELSFFEDILTSFWVNQTYHLLFWPSLLLVVVLEILPMRKALHEGLKMKKTRILCYAVLVGMILLFWAEAPVFFAEVISIMTHQHPEIIVNGQLYEQTQAQLFVYQLVYPIVAKLIIQFSFKRSLRNQGLPIEESIRHYAPKVFPILFMTLIISAIWVVTVNDILI
jgi:hypothetical protein